MRAESLFSIAFREGCGLSLNEVLNSEELSSRISDNLAILDKIEADEEQLDIYSLGPFLTSQAFYEYVHQIEEEKTETPQRPRKRKYKYKTFSAPDQNMIERSIIEHLGQKLMDQAFNELPLSLQTLAQEFRDKKSLDDRFGIIRELYNKLIELKKHYAVKERKQSHPEQFTWHDLISEVYDYRASLPHQYQGYGSGELMPACLGIAMMIAGWAEKAGVRCLVANMIEHNEYLDRQYDGKMANLALEDIDRRGLRISESQRMSLDEGVQTAEEFADYRTDYHPIIAMEIKPGYWFCVDPYLNYLSFIDPENWPIYSIVANLQNYSRFHPGATISTHDHGTHENWHKKWVKTIEEMLALSSSLEPKIKKIGNTLDEMDRFIRRNPELRSLRKLMRQDGIKQPTQVIWLQMLGLKQDTAFDSPLVEEKKALMTQDPVFRQECFDRMLTLFHLLTLGIYYDKLESIRVEPKSGVFYLPPKIEFGLPKINLALQCLNNINIWGPKRSPDFSSLVLTHCSSQILWHDAIRMMNSKELAQTAKIRKIAKAVIISQEPHLHKNCQILIEEMGAKQKGANAYASQEAAAPRGQ